MQFIYTMKGLGKIHPPDTQVLRDIWLSFFPGAKIGVLGSNGAGKSSLLKIMAGEDQHFTGEAFPAAIPSGMPPFSSSPAAGGYDTLRREADTPKKGGCMTMKLRCGILDDYQNTALTLADWSRVADRVEVETITRHIEDPEELAERLRDFDILVIMRERTPFPASLCTSTPGATSEAINSDCGGVA